MLVVVGGVSFNEDEDETEYLSDVEMISLDGNYAGTCSIIESYPFPVYAHSAVVYEVCMVRISKQFLTKNSLNLPITIQRRL